MLSHKFSTAEASNGEGIDLNSFFLLLEAGYTQISSNYYGPTSIYHVTYTIKLSIYHKKNNSRKMNRDCLFCDKRLSNQQSMEKHLINIHSSSLQSNLDLANYCDTNNRTFVQSVAKFTVR